MKEKINPEKLPKHVAIIMDGNGRWARKRGAMRIFGHENAVLAVRETVEAAAEIGIKYLSLFTFSTENWNRPKYEVDALMQLLVKTINNETKTLIQNNIRLQAIGDIKSLHKDCYNELMNTVNITAGNERMTLILALSYSSKWEITEAVKNIAIQVKDNKLQIDDINQDLISSSLTTKGIPDPDLLIRTSGEYRISNFLLWQLAYTELYFSKVLWPDFRKNDFYNAILDFQNRERRFGMTSEQIKI
jgi:undecaprenyl diphosphate synthase